MSGIDGIGSRAEQPAIGQVEGGDVARVGPTQPGSLGVSEAPPPATVLAALRAAPSLAAPRVDAATAQRCLEALPDLLSGERIDFSQILVRIQEEQQKGDKEQMATQQRDLEGKKVEIKANVDSQLQKIGDVIKKIQEQNKASFWQKLFGGLAVFAALVAAVATGGALAIGVAVVAATVFALQESGAMKKMFDAMGASQEVQMGIMIGISVLLAVVSIGSALRAAGQVAATTGAAVARAAAQGTLRTMMGSMAQVTGGVAKVGEGASQIGMSVLNFQASELEADRKGMEARALKLKKDQDEMIQELQELLQKMEDGVRDVLQVVRSEHESVGQQMRAMRT